MSRVESLQLVWLTGADSLAVQELAVPQVIRHGKKNGLPAVCLQVLVEGEGRRRLSRSAVSR